MSCQNLKKRLARCHSATCRTVPLERSTLLAMAWVFLALFVVLSAVAFALNYFQRSEEKADISPEFSEFRNKYLIIFVIVMGIHDLAERYDSEIS